MNIPVNDYRTKYWDLAPSPRSAFSRQPEPIIEKEQTSGTCKILKRTLSAGSRKLTDPQNDENNVGLKIVLIIVGVNIIAAIGKLADNKAFGPCCPALNR